jgi:hypothetical protein
VSKNYKTSSIQLLLHLLISTSKLKFHTTPHLLDQNKCHILVCSKMSHPQSLQIHYYLLTSMELEHESTIIGSVSKIILKIHRNSIFGNWRTKIDPIQSKLKDKNYRGHGKSCLRIESHTIVTAM